MAFVWRNVYWLLHLDKRGFITHNTNTRYDVNLTQFPFFCCSVTLTHGTRNETVLFFVTVDCWPGWLLIVRSGAVLTDSGLAVLTDNPNCDSAKNCTRLEQNNNYKPQKYSKKNRIQCWMLTSWNGVMFAIKCINRKKMRWNCGDADSCLYYNRLGFNAQIDSNRRDSKEKENGKFPASLRL